MITGSLNENLQEKALAAVGIIEKLSKGIKTY